MKQNNFFKSESTDEIDLTALDKLTPSIHTDKYTTAIFIFLMAKEAIKQDIRTQEHFPQVYSEHQ